MKEHLYTPAKRAAGLMGCAYTEGVIRCAKEIEDPVHFEVHLEEIPSPALLAVPDAVQAWDEFAAEVRELIMAKSQGYGNAWRRQGYMGNLARVLSKGARLENLMWRDEQEPPAVHGSEYVAQAELDRETVTDTLNDLAALCALLVANLKSENRWGRP